MSKVGWDKFIEKHGARGIAFFGTWLGKNPPPGIAPNGKRIPTPFSLLDKVLGKIAKGDYTMDREVAKRKRQPARRGAKRPPAPPPQTMIVVLIADAVDAENFRGFVGRVGTPSNTGKVPCAIGHAFVFEREIYSRGVEALGYLKRLGG